MNIEGKVALVTGGAHRVGKANVQFIITVIATNKIIHQRPKRIYPAVILIEL